MGSNSIPSADAYIDVVLIHKRYLKNIHEVDNLTLKINITKQSDKLASILISDTARKNLLNTQIFETYFETFFKRLKTKIKK